MKNPANIVSFSLFATRLAERNIERRLLNSQANDEGEGRGQASLCYKELIVLLIFVECGSI